MTSAGTNRWLAIGLCLLGGVAVGVSGFSSDSNHPAYIPPALQYLDTRYLADDWWLDSAQHYHFAFFAITALLAKLGVLEVGLAFANILTVAAALYVCFLIVTEFARERRITIFAIFIAIFLMTRTFSSVGSSYLFTPSLQPSSLATAATLAAMLYLLRRRLLACGAWLAIAGLCHINFLVVNIPFFATSYLLVAAQERQNLTRPRDVLVGMLTLLGPSLLLLTLFAPLLLNVSLETLPPARAAAADWIFFQFAVPFHYYPSSFLSSFYPFLCWQALGLLWTRHAVADARQRRVAWAIQIALALVIWSATALTTIVFVPAISRLFLWRLAPFAILFSALMTVVGTSHAAHRDHTDRSRTERITLAVSLVLLPFLFVPASPLTGQILPTHGVSPIAVIVAVLLARVALSWEFGLSLNLRAGPGNAVLVALVLLAAVVTQPGDGKRSRYSLLVQSPQMADERDLYAFIRRSTSPDAQFLIPPDLDYFRLEAERATIVDLKAMPINKSGLIQWYQRLEDISGTSGPIDPQHVIIGFTKLDADRIEHLRRKYGIGYIVTPAQQKVMADGWREVFRNRRYRLLSYCCPDSATARLPMHPHASGASNTGTAYR